MTIIIVCVIAGISTTAFFILWFIVVYRELAGKKRVLDDLEEQTLLHQESQKLTKTDAEYQQASRMIKTSLTLYDVAAKAYNHLLRHPFYCFPGFLMGFRKAGQIAAYIKQSS